jgi:hypothetical protein
LYGYGLVSAQVKSRENEAAAMKFALEPDEAALVSVNAELKLLAGAERSNRRETAAMAQIAETDAMIREQKALVVGRVKVECRRPSRRP